ncbi:unnamed protein product [Parnassius apollo]|uniref:(apollo) hypothetical protein n=1 Tax=Parnassius apollo TaxID=110799 RepID=A0A8S3X8Y1_PARAO|nr:unnamed protein product [Parnassius apollo]
MILRCGLLILFLSFVTTSENVYKNGRLKSDPEFSTYSSWPSLHSGARLMNIRKRETQGQVGENEGGGTNIKFSNPSPELKPLSQNTDGKQIGNINNSTTKILQEDHAKANINQTINELHKEIVPPTKPTVSVHGVEAKNNETTVKAGSIPLDINNPGVLKRGLIVFGGFALMAVAYFIFYRWNHKKIDVNNSHGTSETNQFRYGVLQSDDRRDNMELSRIPLTMESDDDDDEDLEIFDLGQKKKSLSYVNLQSNEDEAVSNSIDIDKDKDLLLDIEDASSDTLINWSNNVSCWDYW